MGGPQWLPGNCVLLTDNPAVTRLSDLSRPQRLAFRLRGSAVRRQLQRRRAHRAVCSARWALTPVG